MNKVNEWLHSLGLGQYEEVFAQNSITWKLLPELTADDLKELGLNIGERREFLIAAAALSNAETELDAETPTVPDAQARSQTQAERRQLTVMFCDLVGSTALSQALDPEALRELMQGYQQVCSDVINKYDGHVAQYLGDGLMTYFGWPRAHEDSAERAIRAGLDIIEALRQVSAPEPLQVRIGIATGAVVVGETGAGDASVPKLAVGETPNLAARVQGLAQADQIIISADTRLLVGGTFQLTDLGEQVLKGIVEPVRAWRVKGLATTDGRFDASRRAGELTPIVGRKEELGILLRRWQLAQGNEGQVVLLSGEPGIGKSRLINALRESLQKDQASAMRFQCSPYHVNSAFWPSIQSLERALKTTPDESAEAKLEKLESLIVGHFERPVTDVRFIASLLSIPASITDERYKTLNVIPQKFKDETLRTLVDITEAAAKQQPTVLLFEDAHWADAATLELLTLMIDRVKTMPLLMLITHRPEFENRWVDHGHVTALNLTKLTRAQTGEIVSHMTQGKTLPADLLEQILAKTDGVPLFIEEVTQSILESGDLIEREGGYEYAGTSRRVAVPTTLRDSLMARLDRYQPVREIAQIGAAIGREFSYQLVAAVAPMPGAALDLALSQLTDSGLAFRRGTPPDAVYTFKHALIQDAAYDSLLKSRRQSLHSKIARALDENLPQRRHTEPEILAHHLTEAGDLSAAIPLWQQAGEQAKKRLALVEANAHLNQGLSLLQTLPASEQRDASELALRGPLGHVYMAMKGWASVELEDSLRLTMALATKLKHDEWLTNARVLLCGNVLSQGRIGESLTIAQEMLKAGEVSGKTEAQLWGHAMACQSCVRLGRLTEGLEHVDALSALYDPHKHRPSAQVDPHDPMILANLFKALAIWASGYPDRAAQLFEEIIVSARERGHPFELGYVLAVGTVIVALRGEAELVRRHANEIEQLGRDNGLPVLWALLAPQAYARALALEGHASEAKALMEKTIASWDAASLKSEFALTNARLAQCDAQLGDVDGALRRIDVSIEIVLRPGWEQRLNYAEILRLKGWMLTLKGDQVGAEENYMASLACAREQQAKSWELRTATSLARLWQQQGRQQDALALLEPVYNWFTEGFDTADLKDARRLLETMK